MSGKINKAMNKREEVWLRAWVVVAGSLGVRKTEAPTAWADDCLKEFDKRFPETKLQVLMVKLNYHHR